MKGKKTATIFMVLSVTFIAFLGWKVYPAQAGDMEHEFAGIKKCAMCHKTDKIGKQFQIWETSKHAHAYETLGTAKAKEYGAARGIDDPQASGKCLKCHSTAYYFTEEIVTDKITVEESIVCETCHGPGKDYMSKAIMENKQDAIANGLIIPDEKLCVKCHNEESPAFKPFEYNERWEKIKHNRPPKEE